ncbi:hypothetical protein N7492_005835 [Penicillium capsulatum]|uniref:DNA-binding protein RAP1 n=1 Tax=Penicillium capsulatum TaxID=69766 RepID=A0A9W9IE36_9EURO|nr:hypothetical protein N7492_005835 [Penicillium capsulatum]KAJ6135065.1 hypothetical protein N7512_000225 [Penicillium capsulatum]
MPSLTWASQRDSRFAIPDRARQNLRLLGAFLCRVKEETKPSSTKLLDRLDPKRGIFKMTSPMPDNPESRAGSRASTSTLFGGSRFWVSQNVPNRSDITKMIKQHGGDVVLTEKTADMNIVDPDRKNLPPGCYRYVELSVRNGRLEDPEKHRAEPSDPRPMGAFNIPRKSTRSDYSLKDDQIVWDYLEPLEKAGGAISGNKIYQEFAKKHPEHSWQSWRSRYTRILRGKPRPGGDKPRSDTPENRVPSPQAHLQLELKPRNDGETLPASSQVASPRASKRKRDSVDETIPSPSKKKAVQPSEAAGSNLDPQDRPGAASPPSHTDTIPETAPNEPRQAETHPNAAQAERSSPKPRTAAEAIFLELPFLDLEPHSDSEGEDDDNLDKDEDQDMPVESWVDAQVEKGISDRESVTAALLHASMDTDVALDLLKTWSAGQELPEMPGVWTTKDDEFLEGRNARDIEKVVKKHGEEASQNRWEYLSISRGLTQA